MKSATEITEILNAYDLTHSAWSAGELVGCSAETVKRYVRMRDAGQLVVGRERPGRAIEPFLEKISKGKIRADIVHEVWCRWGSRARRGRRGGRWRRPRRPTGSAASGSTVPGPVD